MDMSNGLWLHSLLNKKSGGKSPLVPARLGLAVLSLSAAPPGQWLGDEDLLHCDQACLLRTRTRAGTLGAAI